MAVSSHWYTKAVANIMGGETESEAKQIDFLTDDIRIMLCTSDYTPLQNSDETIDDVTNEVFADGYIADGKLLENKTITSGTNVVRFDADDVEWDQSSITARYGVIYDDEGVLTTDKLLIGYIDFGANKTSDHGPFIIQFSADGFLKVTTT